LEAGGQQERPEAEETKAVEELIFTREFDRVARWAGAKRALSDYGTGASVSFAEHRARVGHLADALRRRLNLAPGERFSALLDNRVEYADLWHAGLCGAGVFNSIHSRVSREELRYTLADAGARVAFVSPRFAELLEDVRAELPALEHVVLIGEDGKGVPHDIGYSELLAGTADRLPDEPAESDPCILLYTGGTTGRPRGVLLEQRAVMLNWRRSIEVMQPNAAWNFLQVVPMFHVAALMSVVKVHLAGASITLLPQWDAGQALDVIERDEIGAVSIAPTMGVQLLEHPGFAPERLSSIRYVGYGTAPMPLGLLQRLLAVLPEQAKVCQSYGMTETCSTVTMLDTDDHRGGDPELLASAGRALPGVSISIRDAESRELAPRRTGEIWLRCGSVLSEYWGMPEETAAALAGGWYHTGDVGYVNERGYLFVTDRLKDMIITGGENVYSIEVENAVSTLPGVARVAVVGLPDERWGEAVHAVVQLADGAELTEGQVLRHAAARLAGHKVPKSVSLRARQLPVSPAGKVLKRQLREELRSPQFCSGPSSELN
jgi:acyl-CoA synthetase (AMP-forming)/AMP-acid ligase II